MNSFIPWVGGKSKLLWIINKMAPDHYSRFIDVFGGSGTVTMSRPIQQGCMEVYNDFNSNLTNLFCCVKNRPLALLAELGFLPLNTRDDFNVLYKFLSKGEITDDYLQEEMELTEILLKPPEAEAIRTLLLERAPRGDVRRAADFFKLVRYSFSGSSKSFGGKPCDIRRFFHLIWECSRRLANVIVENKDFEDVIRQYPYSSQEAKKRNQLSMWRESYHVNVACRNAIEETIRQNFDGMHLKKDCLEPVLAEYGYKRTEWVLATTLQELSWDGRFSRANKQWAARRYIPQDERHNAEITVRSHPAILDGFVDLYREAYQKLGLFGPEHCVGDRAEQDYIGKVLVLSPDTLKESCWSQENQLWYAHDGFGCSPHAIGRSVRCTCLSDGEMTRWNRDEFVGVLDEKFLPDWAKESLSQFQQEEAAESPGMNNQSM